MNLISALKEFGKVTRVDWEKDEDGSYVLFKAGRLKYKERTDPVKEFFDIFGEVAFFADDWIEFEPCPACDIAHTCGRSND